MKQLEIKVGFCVAYDWPLLRYAIPPIYKHADIICISLDSERKTWAGNDYEFDQQAFYNLLKELDPLGKIQVHKDNFHDSHLTAGQNEVRQRNKLAEAMGSGGWHIQLDCDEYFLEFEKFITFLRSQKKANKRFNVCCPLITLFKEVDGGFLYVQPTASDQLEYIQIATQLPSYHYGRRNGDFNIYTNFLIIHQSWARSENEIRQKISNWGHINDFNQEKFMSGWKDLDKSNFVSWKNFHPIAPTIWPKLVWQPAITIQEFINNLNQNSIPLPTPWKLSLKNSRFISRLLALLKKLSPLR